MPTIQRTSITGLQFSEHNDEKVNTIYGKGDPLGSPSYIISIKSFFYEPFVPVDPLLYLHISLNQLTDLLNFSRTQKMQTQEATSACFEGFVITQRLRPL